MRRWLSLAVVGAATAAGADPLGVSKAAVVVADGVNAANPKAIPGASVDYSITVTNPLANSTASVAAMTVIDPLPGNVKLSVVDLAGAGTGPIEFLDGNLLGLGLLSSGLSYGFASLASGSDGVDFSDDGTNWTYVPVPDDSGCDPRVRAIRVRLTGTQAAGSGFRLRFRVKVR